MTTRPVLPVSSDDPVEARLRAALAAQAEHDVPGTRLPPEVAWPTDELASLRERRSGHARPAWLAPLVAAASVAVLAVIVVAQGAVRTQVAPAHPPSDTTAAATGFTTGASMPAVVDPLTPALTGAPNADPAPATSPVGGLGETRSGVVDLDGVTLRLPSGWAAHALSGREGWCLGPEGQCLARFTRIDPRREGGVVSPEVENGYDIGDSGSSCPVGTLPSERTTLSAGTAPFGSRTAELRRWRWNCGGTTVDVVQYLLVTAPSWLLYSDRADPATLATLAELTRTASVPTQQPGSQRLYDQGVITSAVRSGDAVTVTITRMRGTDVKTWQSTTERATYRLAVSLFQDGYAPPLDQLVQQRIVLHGDGSAMVRVVFPGG